MLNTDKGVSVFSKIQDRLFYKQTEPKKIARNNQNLQKPSNKSEETEEVRKLYADRGYEAIEMYYRKKYGKINFIKKIYFSLPKWLQKVLMFKR